MLVPAIDVILREAGISEGMRVLVLGTGSGYTALAAAAIVGSRGHVVGLDDSLEALAFAENLRTARQVGHVTFVRGDFASWRAPLRFDAIVGRSRLSDLVDSQLLLRRFLPYLVADGLMVAMDMDISACRTMPAVEKTTKALKWLRKAWVHLGRDSLCAQLPHLLCTIGLRNVTQLGIQRYIINDDIDAALSITSSVKSVLLERAASLSMELLAEMNIVDVLQLKRQISNELAKANAMYVPPTLIGCWGRT